MEKLSVGDDGWLESIRGELIEKECAKHGKYEGYSKYDADCEKCIDEKNAIESQKEELKRVDNTVAKSGLPSKYHAVSFENWITTTENEKIAKENARLFADCKITRMMMLGTCGTGKTMLAAAILRHMVANRAYPIYTTVPRLIRDVRDWNKVDNYGRKISEQESMDKYINADVLIVDELGSGRCTEDDKLIFSEILCDRYADERQTLLITNLSPDAVKEKVIDERATDRMREGGVFVRLTGESKRGK